jgi:hypothetical protein
MGGLIRSAWPSLLLGFTLQRFTCTLNVAAAASGAIWTGMASGCDTQSVERPSRQSQHVNAVKIVQFLYALVSRRLQTLTSLSTNHLPMSELHTA